VLYSGQIGTCLQREIVPWLWIPRKHTSIKSGSWWDIPPTVGFGYSNKGTIQQDCHHTEENTKRFCQLCDHTSTMETVLGHCKQGEILIQVWPTFWPLHSWMQIKYHCPLSRSEIEKS
jgi:hypothetical protein